MSDAHRAVRLSVWLVLERGDPGRRLTVAHPLPVRTPPGAQGRACRLVADHRAEPPIGRELGHEQLARPDVAACSLDEEATPPDRSLDDALHDSGYSGVTNVLSGPRMIGWQA